MKRLMVMIGAVATALGLYAAAPETTELVPCGLGFEAGEPGVPTALPGSLDLSALQEQKKLWLGSSEVATVTPYEAGKAPAHTPLFEDTEQYNYLNIETDGAPLIRTLADASKIGTQAQGQQTNYVDLAEGSVYVDMLVKLSPFEEAPALADGSKIALWVKATENDDTTITTNLMLTCGYLGLDGEPAATNIVLDTPAFTNDIADTWHRLTILTKMDTKPGYGVTYFLVYIDGNLMAASNYDVFETGAAAAVLSDSAQKYVNAKQLFPSMVKFGSDFSGVLSMVQFEGSGQVDDLWIDAGSPYSIDMAIIDPANANVTKVVVDDEEVEGIEGVYTVPAGSEVAITLTAKAGYLFAGNAKTKTLKVEACDEYTIPASEDATKAGFAITVASTTNYYLTFETANAAVKSGETITLVENCTAAVVSTATVDFTFDLNEKTITSDAVATIKNDGAGTMTIKNGTVKNTANAVDKGIAVWARSGSVVIESGTYENASEYEGTIYIGGNTADNKTITITGGTFKNTASRYEYRPTFSKGIVLNVYNTLANKATAFVITGGTYSMDPAGGDDSGIPPTFVANGYGSFAVDSYWVVAAYPKAVAAENAPAAAAGELDVAYTFSATGTCPGAPVATKNVDYYVTFDKAVAKGTITLKALMLNDQLQPVWVTFPMTEDIAAGVPYPLVAAMGKTVNVAEMYALCSFTCGVKNNSAANNGTKMTVQLAMNDPAYEIAKVDYTFGEKKTGFAVIIADTTTTTNFYDTLEAAITACPENGKVAFMSACVRATDLAIDKSVTLDVNGQVVTMKNISIAADKTVTLVNNTCGAPAFVGEGYVYIDGKVTVAAGAKLDMSKLPFGETYGGVKLCTGGIDLASTAEGIFYKWNVPAVDSANWMYGNYPQFFSGSVVVEGSKVTIGSTTWTGVAGNRFALEGEVATATLVGTHNPVQDPATFTYVESYTTFADALAACKAAGTVTLTANYTQSADFDLAGKTLVIGAGTKLTIDDDVVVTKNGGFVQNLGSIEVATGKTLDMSAFGWGAGILPAPGDTTQGTFAIKGTGAVKFAAGTDPNAMLAHNAGFFAGTDNGARFWDGTTEYKYTGTAWAEPVYVAQVGDKKYESLQAAVSAAADGQTVKLIDNVTLADRVEVSTAKAIMVDLNGKTIYPTATCGNHSAFNIGVNGATIAAVVTITNGTIDASAIAESAGETDVITVRAGATANLVDGLTIKINTKDGACAYAFADGTINITGGVYENLTDLDYTWVKDIKGMPLNQANVEAQLITVTGGKFKKYNPANGDDAGLCKTFLAEGYVSVQDANQYWVISEYVEPVAKIGDKEYPTLEAAFADAKEGDTIKLLKDVELTQKIILSNVKCTVDLNTYKITNAESWVLTTYDWLFDILGGCNITFDNGTIELNERMIYFHLGSVVTFGKDLVIKAKSSAKTNNTIRGFGGTLNVYGDLSLTGTEGHAVIDMPKSNSVVNVFAGAKLISTSPVFKVGSSKETSPTINIYGGTLSASGSYPIINKTGANTLTLNIKDGLFLNNQQSNNQIAVAAGVLNCALTDECLAKFQYAIATGWSFSRNLIDLCAPGYAPVKGDDGYYMIRKVWKVDFVVDTTTNSVNNVTNNTPFADIKPADPEKQGYTFTGWKNAPEYITADTLVEAEFKQNSTPVEPGEEKKYDDEASAKAATNNFEVALAPAVDNVVKDKAAYKAMFKPVITKDGDKFVVTAELTPAASNTVQTAVNAAVQAIKISEVAAAASTSDIKVTSSIAGLYYQMNTASDLGGFTPVKEVLGNGGEITFSGVDKPSAAKGFYKISVTTAPVITD